VGKGTSQKPLKREFSAGGVVFKQGENTWLIIKPAGSDRWQFPKGRIDDGESSKNAALREVMEEGGVEASVVEKIGTQKYIYFWEGDRVFKTVTLYLMKYLKDGKHGHDKEVDETAFLPFQEAHNRLTFDNDKKLLAKAKDLLGRGIQENLI